MHVPLYEENGRSYTIPWFPILWPTARRCFLFPALTSVTDKPRQGSNLYNCTVSLARSTLLSKQIRYCSPCIQLGLPYLSSELSNGIQKPERLCPSLWPGHEGFRLIIQSWGTIDIFSENPDIIPRKKGNTYIRISTIIAVLC